MQIQSAISRTGLFHRLDEAKRVASYMPAPQGPQRQAEIASDRDRFEKMPGDTLAAMSATAFEKAQSARKSGQAARLLSLAAGGGMMVCGYASSNKGLMAIGLAVMLGGGMVVANRFDGRSRAMLDVFSSLKQWEHDIEQKEKAPSASSDKMLADLRKSLESGDLKDALSQSKAILEDQDQVVVGDIAVGVN